MSVTYTVWLCIDSVGASPLILGDDSEALMEGEGVRFRLGAEMDDHAEAVRVALAAFSHLESRNLGHGFRASAAIRRVTRDTVPVTP